uniref:C2H2-type domain-containing protein n=1 Tax=Oryza meridionalis TaxID=40149 RepID=A0A0E0DYM0_9ORYZ
MAAPHGMHAAVAAAPDATIRLFGRDVASNDDDVVVVDGQLPKEEEEAGGGGAAAAAGETRRFECHYCRRNFPTSQALGGHQNAHKRERQHARRAHLEASLAAAHYLGPSAHLVYGGASLFGYGHGHHAAAVSPQYGTVWASSAVAPPGLYTTSTGMARSAAYGAGVDVSALWRASSSSSPPMMGSGGAFGTVAAGGRHGEAATAALVGCRASKDENVVMSVVTSLPSLPSWQLPAPEKMGRSELGQEAGVVSLELRL